MIANIIELLGLLIGILAVTFVIGWTIFKLGEFIASKTKTYDENTTEYEKTVCPNCKGFGKYNLRIYEDGDYARTRTNTCEMCRGKGYVMRYVGQTNRKEQS